MNSSYIQTIYNGKQESINNIFSTHVEPLLNDINNPALVQECKINLDAAAYEKIDAKANIPSYKKEIDRHDRNTYWPISTK